MSTRCELSVCATTLVGCCTVAAVTVMTTTCGAGRSAGGFSLEQPYASEAATKTIAKRTDRFCTANPFSLGRTARDRLCQCGQASPGKVLDLGPIARDAGGSP